MRILVADDEVSILEIIELVLTTDGHDVTRAKDGVDCMRKYNEEKAKKEGAKSLFDLVIVDWSMPQLSGLDVIKEILKHDPDQKVLLATAYSKEILPSLGELSEKIQVIHKPFDIDDLSRIVNSLKKH